jgi:hypothetical protein
MDTSRVLSYKDIVEAQQNRDIKDVEAIVARGRGTSKRSTLALPQVV